MQAEKELVEHARAALHRLSRTREVASIGDAGLAALDDEARRTPLLVGIDGTAAARLHLLDVASGGLFGAIERGAKSPTLRLRRGERTAFRAVSTDGRIEEATMPPPARAASSPTEDTVAVDVLERGLPRLVRVRPPWWAFWLWIIRWILLIVQRDRIAQVARARTAADEKARERATTTPPEPDDRARFVTKLRGLATRGYIRGISIETPDAPPVVELVELERPYADPPDLVIAATGAETAESVLRLVARASVSRAIRIGTRALGTLREGVTALDAHLAAAEVGFTARLEALERLRIEDRPAIAATELARVRPVAIAHATKLLEHVSKELSGALGQLETIWVDELTNSTTTDELKAAIARIYDGSPRSVQSLLDATSKLALGNLGNALHDLYPDLVQTLHAEHGLPAIDPPEPSLPAMPLFARTQRWTLGERPGNWLTGLFRSFDAKRSDALAKVKQGATSLRDLAHSELLDLEPVLHATLDDALAAELDRAIDRQIRWLDDTLASERASVEADREALEPARQARALAAEEAARLGEQVDALSVEA